MIEFVGNRARWSRFKLKFMNLRDKTGVFVGKGSEIANRTTIGDGSRFNGKVIIKGKGVCDIGKYTAFGHNIIIITSNHKTSSVNLQYALSRKIGLTPEIDDKSGVKIGHNVWVGDGTIILPGVSIGNGAIIGAGSVVTKNVLPYGIAGGSPATFIKSRLPEERIKEIEEMEWWNWPLVKMRQNAHLLR